MCQERKEMASSILNEPESYKVCLVCGAIVDKNAETCPDCYAYRFDEDPAEVSNRALDMAAKAPTAVGHLDITD